MGRQKAKSLRFGPVHLHPTYGTGEYDRSTWLMESSLSHTAFFTRKRCMNRREANDRKLKELRAAGRAHVGGRLPPRKITRKVQRWCSQRREGIQVDGCVYMKEPVSPMDG